MTKKEKRLVDTGMRGSIRAQASYFAESWITRKLYKEAVKLGQNTKY
ncbi:hypothetical protein LAT59_01170 [Candidatus Gracilibacteria bacterium]|nr:hypothetical protein [Candidatus Gracilibacteria bacterium]